MQAGASVLGAKRRHSPTAAPISACLGHYDQSRLHHRPKQRVHAPATAIGDRPRQEEQNSDATHCHCQCKVLRSRDEAWLCPEWRVAGARAQTQPATAGGKQAVAVACRQRPPRCALSHGVGERSGAEMGKKAWHTQWVMSLSMFRCCGGQRSQRPYDPCGTWAPGDSGQPGSAPGHHLAPAWGGPPTA